MAKPYSGESPEMRFLKRSALCMTVDDFLLAGEKMSRREHVLDLRLPEAEKTFESPGYPKESDFDAIRINSWPVLKALARILTISTPVAPWQVPYVFWVPFLPLVVDLQQLEKYLMNLKDELAQKHVALPLDPVRDANTAVQGI